MCNFVIDRNARNELSELLRRLAAGLITNDEFEDSIPESDDLAIQEVFFNGGWRLYSDMSEYKLKGKDALDKVVKKEVAKWVLFLKSDTEYRWPSIPFTQRVLYVVTFGILGSSYTKKWSVVGDLEAWPFLNYEEFENAKSGHGYLGS